ncbi:hypothetical protein [Rothia sp. (in: high G+C Gram-positive bacteria)]|uniref:hypothetical protein n=1 Tax=unclassified Rothia (in: high G+C Gram-positive bacteria) TaxID=2689056 RepID=UPI000EDF62A9|nr:hypothetical protein [Rothia sp. (in: high G+C Gram-positive bacteria)]
MRAIKTDEQAILEATVRSALPIDRAETNPTQEERQQILDSLANTQVVRECECGTCPSITLALDTPTTGYSGVLSAETVDDSALVLVHIRQGAVKELEIAPLHEGVSVALPAPAALVLGELPSPQSVV